MENTPPADWMRRRSAFLLPRHSAAVCTYLTRSLSSKKIWLIASQPPTRRLDTHTSKLDVCGSPFHVRAHTRGSHTHLRNTHIYAQKKSSRHAKLTEREEYVCRVIVRRPYLRYFSIAVDTLFHYFRVKARSFSVLPSHFRLYIFPRRYACSLIFCSAETLLIDFFFLLARQPSRVEWRLVGIVRLHSANRPRFVSNHSFRAR